MAYVCFRDLTSVSRDNAVLSLDRNQFTMTYLLSAIRYHILLSKVKRFDRRQGNGRRTAENYSAIAEP